MTADPLARRVDNSYQLDADRARDSYLNHTATALRRRALSDRGPRLTSEGERRKPQKENDSR